jgi:hypothetical protein
MDTIFETAGAQAAVAGMGALWALGIPFLLACAGVAWRFFRVAEDGIARPLGFTLLSTILILWLLGPTPEGPRFLALLNGAADLAVRRAIFAVDRDFLSDPFRDEREAALLEMAHVRDPRLREELALFFATCTANAMASTGTFDPVNPLSPATPLSYADLTASDTGRSCDAARDDLWRRILAEQGGQEEFAARVVRNEWNGRAPGAGEMALVRSSVGSWRGDTGFAAMRPWTVAGAELHGIPFGNWIEGIVTVADEALANWAIAGQASSDWITSCQRYYLVCAYAPWTYGLVVMLLSALFPVAAMASLLPGKWTVLLNYAKVFLSVKLWPLGWSIVTMFGARRASSGALDFADTPDIWVAITLIYFLVPGLCFLVVNLAAGAAAVPFRDSAPAVAGPANGPAGEVARTAIARVR